MGMPTEPLEPLETSYLGMHITQTSLHTAHVFQSETDDEGDGGFPGSGREVGCNVLVPVASYTQCPAVQLQLQGERQMQATLPVQFPTFGDIN